MSATGTLLAPKGRQGDADMNRHRLVCTVALVMAMGCGGSSDDSGLSKDDARRHGGKGDDGGDACADNGWYGDGQCDDFCPEPDTEDCEGCGGLAGQQCASA